MDSVEFKTNTITVNKINGNVKAPSIVAMIKMSLNGNRGLLYIVNIVRFFGCQRCSWIVGL